MESNVTGCPSLPYFEKLRKWSEGSKLATLVAEGADDLANRLHGPRPRPGPRAIRFITLLLY